MKNKDLQKLTPLEWLWEYPDILKQRYGKRMEHARFVSDPQLKRIHEAVAEEIASIVSEIGEYRNNLNERFHEAAEKAVATKKQNKL